jgi:hypothetical protein
LRDPKSAYLTGSGTRTFEHRLQVVKYKNLAGKLTNEIFHKDISDIGIINYLIGQGATFIYSTFGHSFWENYIDYLKRIELFKRLIPKLPKELCVVIHKYMKTLRPINEYKKQLVIIKPSNN